MSPLKFQQKAVRLCLSLLACFAVQALTGTCSAAQAAPREPAPGEARYTIANLGRWVEVHAINNSGDVVGGLWIPDGGQPSFNGHYRAFIYSKGQMHDLGTFGGGSSLARGINALGQVVGDYWSDSAGRRTIHGFLLVDGQFQDLAPAGKPGEETLTRAESINLSGQITGQRGGGQYSAAHYSSAKVQWVGAIVPPDFREAHTYTVIKANQAPTEETTLGAVGFGYSTASKINDSGDIVGLAEAADGGEHAFLYSKGRILDLGTLGGKYSHAMDINNAGTIVGRSAAADGHNHAFMYSNGKMRDLGVPKPEKYNSAEADGINNAGVIVGWAQQMVEGRTEGHAFIFAAEKWSDLNLQVSLAGSGLDYLLEAQAINDAGQIIGKAMAADGWHGYLLTPIPPATK